VSTKSGGFTFPFSDVWGAAVRQHSLGASFIVQNSFSFCITLRTIRHTKKHVAETFPVYSAFLLWNYVRSTVQAANSLIVTSNIPGLFTSPSFSANLTPRLSQFNFRTGFHSNWPSYCCSITVVMGNGRHPHDNLVLLIMLFIGLVKNVSHYIRNLLVTTDQIKLPLIPRVELYWTSANITCSTDIFG
jgi:hypothetical protein